MKMRACSCRVWILRCASCVKAYNQSTRARSFRSEKSAIVLSRLIKTWELHWTFGIEKQLQLDSN